MNKFSRRMAFAGTVACAVVLWSAGQAVAGGSGSWGSSGGGSGGSSGSYWGGGSSGGSSGFWNSSSGSSGGWKGGIFQRWWDEHRAKKAYGSSGASSGGASSGGGSSGTWGSSGGGLFGHRRSHYRGGSSGASSGTWGASSGGSSGSYSSSGGSSGGSTIYNYAPSDSMPTPAVPSSDMPADSAPSIPAAPTSYRGNDAVINVNVPEGAKIYVNDKATSSTGTERRFVSRDLKPGFKFAYEVRAERRIDGRLIRQVKTIQLTAGQQEDLSFSLDPDSPADAEVVGAPVETKVTLYVPEYASVKLAGNEMRTLGDTRVFSTVALAPGEIWKDYDIVVTVLRNGKPETQRKIIDLTGGDEKTVRFDFGADKVASL